MERDGLGWFELLVLLVGGATMLVVGVTWAGALLALRLAGSSARASFGEAASAAPALPGHLGDPGGAWPGSVADELPGPVFYWASTLAAAVAATSLVWLAAR